MQWVEKVLDRLGEAVEWHSPGKLCCRYIEGEDSLLVSPAPLEMVGGADDGESVYPFYTLHLSHLIEIFDETPEMMWQTMANELSLEGTIGGEGAWLVFSREPFEDDEPQDVVDPKGGIRPKKPPE